MGEAEREFPRYATEVAVLARRGGRVWRGTTSNLSRGGMCARFDAAMPLGEALEFDLTLVFDEDTRSEKLTVSGRVAWCTPIDSEHQAGITFAGLAGDYLQYLELFIRYLDDHRQRARDATPSVDDGDLFG